MSDKPKQRFVRIEPDAHKALKYEHVRTGLSLQRLVSIAALEYVQRNAPKPRTRKAVAASA